MPLAEHMMLVIMLMMLKMLMMVGLQIYTLAEAFLIRLLLLCVSIIFVLSTAAISYIRV